MHNEEREQPLPWKSKLKPKINYSANLCCVVCANSYLNVYVWSCCSFIIACIASVLALSTTTDKARWITAPCNLRHYKTFPQIHMYALLFSTLHAYAYTSIDYVPTRGYSIHNQCWPCFSTESSQVTSFFSSTISSSHRFIDSQIGLKLHQNVEEDINCRDERSQVRIHSKNGHACFLAIDVDFVVASIAWKIETSTIDMNQLEHVRDYCVIDCFPHVIIVLGHHNGNKTLLEKYELFHFLLLWKSLSFFPHHSQLFWFDRENSQLPHSNTSCSLWLKTSHPFRIFSTKGCSTFRAMWFSGSWPFDWIILLTWTKFLYYVNIYV